VNLLERICADKRVEIARRRRETPLERLRELAVPPPPPFAAALRAAPLGLIAEVKRRSPSVGVIREPFVPAEIAAAYAHGGAHALSVLVDEPYFGGGETPFREVRAAVSLPLLYKEFVVDAWQIWHARALGASALLLIAAVLDDPQLHTLLAECRAAGLEALVEVHDEGEMTRAAAARADLIGINNRDLKTFVTTLETTARLAPLAPPACTLVSESGIRDAVDARRARSCGAHAVLVGEHLLKRPELAAAVQALLRI
jgi:indole-3-glycerol phosphate synthase